MLREPSVRVRETAAEQLEERQSDWAYSKPVIILDILWNMAFVVMAVVVLGLSLEEKPSVPLRLWIWGYGLQCLFHGACVAVEYKIRNERRVEGLQSNEDPDLGLNSESGSEAEDSEDNVTEELNSGDETRVAKSLESANTMFSFLWWIIGFYWIIAKGQVLTHQAPKLYWLCVTFLALDVVFVFICFAVACLIGLAVCCCLPCIIAILYALTDRECCICLSAYEDGTELRELPCDHHFHCNCIDKWLYINATCPLCKFNILKGSEEV
ncbi:E3 ubiquitin-protein ligase At4g11680 isoform X1 [Gossypium hirsutum]|uniref:RING-type E3 ubiquitin transferase n=1 Tax=Gossypium hirsutum TaxID=3635 RepID=A0A1U8PAJ8_GOSHI|nr:E3 ubiquitin-protein ligase At4g11680-like isoform X1 [Gossypium hirsutum]